MSASDNKSKQRAGVKRRLRAVFATRIGGIIGGYAVLNTLVLIFAAMVYGTLVYQAQGIEALEAYIEPTVEKIMDSSTDAEARRKELSKFSELEFVSYVAITDDNAKTLGEWKREGIDVSFHHTHARHIADGDYDFTTHGMYNRFKIKKYTLVVGTGIAATIKNNLAEYWGLYTMIALVIGGLIAIVFYLFSVRILNPLLEVTEYATRIIDENDLTIAIPTTYRNEIGRVAKCVNLVMNKLRNILLLILNNII